MTDDELIAGFEGGTLTMFHHPDHVHVAWIYLTRLPLLAAVHAFAKNLRKFAMAHGKPGLYHETITYAYVFLIHDRMVRNGPFATWDEFAAANADLLAWRPSVLRHYYSSELLDSPLARKTFVWPDRTV